MSDCLVEGHYRQGMSLIDVQGLLVERTVFAGTNGTAPMAGIDIEPNNPRNSFSDVIIRDSVCRGNTGGGLLMNLARLNSSSEPVDIRVVNLTVDGLPVDRGSSSSASGSRAARAEAPGAATATPGIGLAIGNVDGVQGTIAVSDSTIRNTGGCGFALYRKAASAARVTITRTSFSQVALGVPAAQGQSPHGCAPHGGCVPLLITSSWDPPATTNVGGIAFENCTVVDLFARDWLECADPGFELVDIDGEFDVTNPHGCHAAIQPNQTGVGVRARCHSSA